jgi:hypothetical protein
MNFHELVGRMFSLENVSSIDSVQPSFAATWAHNAPAWVLLGCLALTAIAFGFYFKYQAHSRGKAKAALAVMRAALLSMLLVVLADPVLTVKLTNHPRPLLWVLFDGTDSMAIEDELPPQDRERLAAAVGLASDSQKIESGSIIAKPTRADFVKAWVRRSENNPLTKLAEKFRLRGYVFDRADGVRGIELGATGDQVNVTQAANELTTNGQVTALGKALEDLSLRHATSNLAGLVVVSDFDQNSGPPAIAKAKSLGVPIYTVGVGPTAAVDLSVNLQAPLMMKKAEKSTVTVTLRQTGLDDQQVTVNVTARRMDGASSGGSNETLSIGEKTAVLGGAVSPVEFPFTPEQTGRFEFIAHVSPLPGEVVEQNNRSSREVNIRDDFLRLMYVEYEPTWEWRFIKEVFHRDKLVGLRGFRTFLRSADPKVRKSNELFLPTLTPQRSEFFANDVMFLGDMPSSTVTPRFAEMVKEFVSTFGGGLVVIAGPRFGPGQLAPTPLADMLPVVVDPDARLQEQKAFRLRLSADAEQVDFMRLGSSDAENRKAWDNLGPLQWYQPVSRLHPLATALAEHPTDTCSDGKTPQPLIAIRRFGKGEVVYLGFNETWRLRRLYGEQYYRQFWGQMIHRLGLSHALGSQKRFVVRTDRQQYQADDKVIVTAEAYDANFEPLSDEKLTESKLTGELIVPDRAGEVNQPQNITLTQLREGVFETQIPVFTGGEHRVRVKDPITSESTEVAFQVTSLSAERRSAVRNVALQEEIAQVSGGRSYDLETASDLAQDIQLKPLTETSIKVFPLASTWLCFGLVVSLMLGEWLIRKLVNLA